MKKSKFGNQLRTFRLACRDAETNKSMTQAELAEYLSLEIGKDYTTYTGAAVSDWERGESTIHVNDRIVLNAIIKILKQHGGIKSISDANVLLESGNYRALNQEEIKILFPEAITEKETDGAIPVWAKESVIRIRKFTDSLSAWHYVKFIAWVWIFFITYWFIIPSLQFPFTDNEVAIKNMRLYVIGTLFIPLAIGWMTNLKNNSYWKEQNIQKPINLWLYTFQGAYVGFHVGYFFMFFLTLMLTQFNLHVAIWFEMIKILLIMIVSYTSAHLVPYNLWRAYQRLELKDGWIFFVFIFVSPVWAWFFIEFHETLTTPILGTVIILIAITLVVIKEFRASKVIKNNSPS